MQQPAKRSQRWIERSAAAASDFRDSPLYLPPLSRRSRCGGTGRRAGLKIRFWQQSVGSIPSTGTITLVVN